MGATEHIEFPHLTLLKTKKKSTMPPKSNNQKKKEAEAAGRAPKKTKQQENAGRAPSKRSRKCRQRRLQTRKRSLAGKSMRRGWLLHKIRKWSDAKLIQED